MKNTTSSPQPEQPEPQPEPAPQGLLSWPWTGAPVTQYPQEPDHALNQQAALAQVGRDFRGCRPRTLDLSNASINVQLPDNIALADWRGYIPESIRLAWPHLDYAQRLLIAFMAQTMADYTGVLLSDASIAAREKQEKPQGGGVWARLGLGRNK